MLRQELTTRLRQNSARLGRFLPYAGSGLFTFFLSNTRVLGSLSPFGAAFSMAMPGNFSLSSVAGGLLSCTLLGNFEQNIPYLIAFLCILAFKLGVAGQPRLRANQTFLCVSAFAILAVSLEVGTVINGENLAGFLLRLAESALGGAMTCFSLHAVRALSDIREGREPAGIRLASFAILCLTVLAGMAGVSLWMLNPGRIAAAFLLLWISGRRGLTAGAVGGLAAAAAFTLADPDFAVSGGIMAVAAMLSGAFGRFGRLTQTAMFLSTATAGILITGAGPSVVTSGFDLLIGAAAFLLLPERVYLRLKPAQTADAAVPSENSRIAAQLSFASQTVQEIRASVDAVSKRLGKTAGSSIQDVYDRTAERVCRRCGLKMFCWETAFNQTTDAFQKLTPLLKEHGRVYKEDLPHFFTSKCPKTDELVQNVNGCYHEYISRENAGRKVLGAKQVAMEQLEGVAELLEDVGRDLDEGELTDHEAARKVEGFLSEIGEEAGRVFCVVDRYGRMRVELYRDRPLRSERGLLTEQLSELLERPFDLPCVVTAGDLHRVSFFEKAKYTLEFAACQKNAGDSTVCGDSYEYFADPRGYAHIILSDGMGSGGRAAVDSIMTCNFVLKLVKAGFRFDAALRFINSALLVKAGDESLATLDIGCIDLYTGTAEFLKAGGASSFVSREGRAASVKGTSLPVGILQGVEYDRHKVQLREGDLVVMVTDGALPISDEWMAEEIAAIDGQPARTIAERLAELAKYRQQGRGDDITVIAARLTAAGM